GRLRRRHGSPAVARHLVDRAVVAKGAVAVATPDDHRFAGEVGRVSEAGRWSASRSDGGPTVGGRVVGGSVAERPRGVVAAPDEHARAGPDRAVRAARRGRARGGDGGPAEGSDAAARAVAQTRGTIGAGGGDIDRADAGPAGTKATGPVFSPGSRSPSCKGTPRRSSSRHRSSPRTMRPTT